MDRNRSLVPAAGATDPAGIAVPFEDIFPQPPEILFVMALERVAGGAQSQGQDLRLTASAGHRQLGGFLGHRT